MEANDIAWAVDCALEAGEKRTRRDRFAMAALTGLLANPHRLDEGAPEKAVNMADKTIAELDKEQSRE